MIKFTDLLKEMLNEEKQVGTLYHFTTYEFASDIIKDGYKLKNLSKDDEGKSYISFTRDRNLISPTISRNVRFTIDGTGLSNKYKITPYSDVKAGFKRTTFGESEERVSVEGIGGTIDFSKYLKAIDVMKPGQAPPDDDDFEMLPDFLSEYENLVDYLKQNNVKFNLVSSYAR